MKIMTAKYKGKCYACDVRIKPGDAIEYHGVTGSKHVDCPSACAQKVIADLRKSRSITQLGDFGDVYALFEIAAKGGKWPRITINADGFEFFLYVSGPQAMIPNVINVKTRDEGDSPKTGWYGRITIDGAWDQRHKEVDERMADALSRLAMDPVGTVAMYGRTSGKCCFCKKQLTNAPSVDAGYGPACAKRWGLAWGGKVWGMTADGKYGPVDKLFAEPKAMIQNGSEYEGPSQPPSVCDYCNDTGKVANTEPGVDDVVCMGCVAPQWNPQAALIKVSELAKAAAAAPKETVTLKSTEVKFKVNLPEGYP